MEPAISKFHAGLDAAAFDICEHLYALINAALPDAESKIWHRHPVWFLGGNPIAGYSRLKSCVRVMFWSGQSFVTPGLQADGSFKAASLRIIDAAEIDAERMALWLEEARVIQWDYKNIVKRRGRLVRLSE